MFRNTLKYIFLVALVSVFVLAATGCPNAAKKPGVPDNQTRPRGPGGKEPTITLFINETGEKKEIKMEEYLKGVVAAEMDTFWPVEALAAQAILARTFTIKKIQQGGVKEHGTNASTSVEEFQSYAPDKINDRVEKAVARTRGKVVTYKGNYINGWFFADGGGKTAASAQEGLAFKKEPAPYVQSVKDPGFAITVEENKSWTATFPLRQVRQAVKEKAGQDPGSIDSVKIIKKGPSGRATSIRVGKVTVSGPALRLALGSTKMRSTLIDSIAVKGSNLVISGKGYGHGVGMSQWGAKALAQQGKSPEEIINYFFKDVRIQKVWD